MTPARRLPAAMSAVLMLILGNAHADDSAAYANFLNDPSLRLWHFTAVMPQTAATKDCDRLKLPMKAAGKNIDRAAIGVVARIGNELIIEADFGRRRNGVAVVGLDDLLESGMRELPIPEEDA